LNPNGSVVSDTEIAPASINISGSPDLVWSGSEYGLIWKEAGTRFVRLDGAGAPKAPPVINLGGNNQFRMTLSWSSIYGGYALGGIDSSGAFFRLLGADGTMPQPPNIVTYNPLPYASAQVAAAPAGGWGLSFGTLQQQPGFAIFNADGSRTQPVVPIGNFGIQDMTVGLVHDGTTYLTTWVNGPQQQIVVNRGTAQNAPAAAVTVTSPFRVGPPSVKISNGTVGMAWAQYDATSSIGPYTVRAQRFAIPSTTASALTPLHNPVDVIATPTAQTDVVSIVYTSTTTMLAVWVDNRWGTAEIYSAPLDLGACP
jgi:hypothetical protein